jgi:hypothetical protein
LKRLRDELRGDRERLSAMMPLAGGKRSSAARQPSVLDATSSPGLELRALPEPTAADAERPIGRVVISGPLLDRGPVQPRTTRNVAIGVLLGLVTYVMASFFWAASDQRIHGVEDLHELNIDINVFGSVPRTGRRSPVIFGDS